MTLLDCRLYAWLSEPDERRFERAFTAYFSIAFPAVVRHLARLSRWDPSDLEDLAQTVLLKFFDKIGRGRRVAAESISLGLSKIRPVLPQSFHQRQVSTWTRDVSSFSAQAMSFRIAEPLNDNDSSWKAEIRVLTERIGPLEGTGCRLLEAIRSELGWILQSSEQVDSGAGDADINVASAVDRAEAQISLREFALQFLKEANEGTLRAADACRRLDGLVPFVEGTSSVTIALPGVRVPTNGYLFEMAMSAYLDECKSRGRKKRGGEGIASHSATDQAHPIESEFAAPFELAAECDSEDRGSAIHSLRTLESAQASSPDSTQQIEDADFLERFHDYLREPVDAAMSAYRQAAMSGKAIAQRRRLESLSDKFARTMAVLTSIGEGFTQEGTAKRLGLTRNQVKYIVELVQNAWVRFEQGSAQTQHFAAGEANRYE